MKLLEVDPPRACYDDAWEQSSGSTWKTEPEAPLHTEPHTHTDGVGNTHLCEGMAAKCQKEIIATAVDGKARQRAALSIRDAQHTSTYTRNSSQIYIYKHYQKDLTTRT